MTDEELKEILKTAPVISDEELENDYYHSAYELCHEALHDFTNECMKIDHEEGWDRDNRVYSGNVGLPSAGDDFRKVNFRQYRHSCTAERLNSFVNGTGEELTVEEVRELMYGYTFTSDYAREPVTSVFSMEWWKGHLGEENGEFSRQEELIAEAILGTGDGKTPETAFCVIDIYQEYELLSMLMPGRTPLVTGWSLLPGNIDCLELEPNRFGVDRVYFDVSRRFEVGMDDSESEESDEL